MEENIADTNVDDKPEKYVGELEVDVMDDGGVDRGSWHYEKVGDNQQQSDEQPILEPVIDNSTNTEPHEPPSASESESTRGKSQTDDSSAEGDEDKEEPMSYDLQIGFRILKEIMTESNKSLNVHFMNPVDAESLGLWDYHERVPKPMWLNKIHEKFVSREYQTITEFVKDFRLMLENCYRYNGPDHYVSKRGQKLELVMEQKLSLLSRELREKTSIAATSGKPVEEQVISGTRRRKVLVPHDSTALLNQLRLEEQQREKEARKQQMMEKKQIQEAWLQELQSWENSLFPDNLREEMKAMWEIPQIGHFLFLCTLPLNLGEVVHAELERSFAIPRESSTMQLVMTSLLSTPYQRTRLDKKPPMPYSVWEEKLRIRTRQWYKCLHDNGCDLIKTSMKLGFEEKFFKVIGIKNPLERKKYHELTFYQRVWIMKGLCDWCLQNQESIREAMEAQPIEEQRDYYLGCDGEGNTYIHFPQFCGADLRVYRCSAIKMPKLDLPKKEKTVSKRSQNLPSSRKRKKKKKQEGKEAISSSRSRDSRLRQHPRQVVGPVVFSSTSSDSDSGISGSDSDVIMPKHSRQSPSPMRTQRKAQGRRVQELTGLSDTSRENTPTRNLRSQTISQSNTPSRESTPTQSVNKGTRKKQSMADSRSSTPSMEAFPTDRRSRGRRKKKDVNEESNIAETMSRQGQSENEEGVEAADEEEMQSPQKKIKKKSLTSEKLKSKCKNKKGAKSKVNQTVEETAYEIDMEVNESKKEKNRNADELTNDKNEDNVVTHKATDCDSAATLDQVTSMLSQESKHCALTANQDSTMSKKKTDVSDMATSEMTEKEKKMDIEDETKEKSSTESSEIIKQELTIKQDFVLKGSTSSKMLENNYVNEHRQNDSTSPNLVKQCVKDNLISTKDAEDINQDVLSNGKMFQSSKIDKSEPFSFKGKSKIANTDNLPDASHTSKAGEIPSDKETDINLVAKNSAPVMEVKSGNICEVKSESESIKSICNSESSHMTSEATSMELENKTIYLHEKCKKESSVSLGDIKPEIVENGMTEMQNVFKTGNLENENKQISKKFGIISENENMLEQCLIKTEENDKEKENAVSSSYDVKLEVTKEMISQKELKTKSEIVANVEVKHESKLVIKSETEPETKTESEMKPKPETKPETKPDPTTKPEPETKPGQELKHELDTKPDPDSKSEPETKSEPEIKTDPETKPEQELEPEPEPEIKGPVLGEFELIVETVEGLKNLTLKFAEPESIVEIVGKKERILRGPPRKRCEADLHERLLFLLKELEPWEQRLLAAAKKAKVKIRKEHESYIEEPEVQEDVWESEESASESSDSEESECSSGEESKTSTKQKEMKEEKKRPQRKKEKVGEMDLEEEIGMSSRGRVIKRRIDPNNVEDPGIKKRKFDKDQSPSPTPNILQSSKSRQVSESSLTPTRAAPESKQPVQQGAVSILNINNQTVLVGPGQNPVIVQTTQPMQSMNMTNLTLLAQLTGVSQPKFVTVSTPQQTGKTLDMQQAIQSFLAARNQTSQQKSVPLQSKASTPHSKVGHVKQPLQQAVVQTTKTTVLTSQAGIATPSTSTGTQQSVVSTQQHSSTQKLANTEQSTLGTQQFVGSAQASIVSAQQTVLGALTQTLGGQQLVGAQQKQVTGVTQKSLATSLQQQQQVLSAVASSVSTTCSVPEPEKIVVSTSGENKPQFYMYNNIAQLPPHVIQQLLKQQGSVNKGRSAQVATTVNQVVPSGMQVTLPKSSTTSNPATALTKLVQAGLFQGSAKTLTPGVPVSSNVSTAVTQVQKRQQSNASIMLRGGIPQGMVIVTSPQVIARPVAPVVSESRYKPIQIGPSDKSQHVTQASQVTLQGVLQQKQKVESAQQIGQDLLTQLQKQPDLVKQLTPELIAQLQLLQQKKLQKQQQVIQKPGQKVVQPMQAGQQAAMLAQLHKKQQRDQQQKMQKDKVVLEAGTSTDLSQANPSLLKALNSPKSPPNKRKYAGNVTVKSLLESRAQQKAKDGEDESQDDDCRSPTNAENTAKSGTQQATLNTIDNSSVSPRKGTANMASGATIVLPGTAGKKVIVPPLGPSQQAAISDAVKDVIVEVQTSLPTAQIKVNSPYGMPVVKTHRSITITTSAMKAPIPAVPSLITPQLKKSPDTTSTLQGSLATIVPPSSAISSTAGVNINTETKSACKPNVTPISANMVQQPGQQAMLLRIVQQNLAQQETSEGRNTVQGVVTPQGIILPKQQIVQAQALAAAKGPAGNVVAQNVLIRKGKGQVQLIQIPVGTYGNVQPAAAVPVASVAAGSTDPSTIASIIANTAAAGCPQAQVTQAQNLAVQTSAVKTTSPLITVNTVSQIRINKIPVSKSVAPSQNTAKSLLVVADHKTQPSASGGNASVFDNLGLLSSVASAHHKFEGDKEPAVSPSKMNQQAPSASLQPSSKTVTTTVPVTKIESEAHSTTPHIAVKTVTSQQNMIKLPNDHPLTSQTIKNIQQIAAGNQVVAKNTTVAQHLKAAAMQQSHQHITPVSDTPGKTPVIPQQQLIAAEKLTPVVKQVTPTTSTSGTTGKITHVQLTGTSAGGKTVHLRLAVPVGMTIQQAIQSPALQQQLASLQLTGLTDQKVPTVPATQAPSQPTTNMVKKILTSPAKVLSSITSSQVSANTGIERSKMVTPQPKGMGMADSVPFTTPKMPAPLSGKSVQLQAIVSPRKVTTASIASNTTPISPSKLMLVNVNGQLMTTQGVPVTISQGMVQSLSQTIAVKAQPVKNVSPVKHSSAGLAMGSAAMSQAGPSLPVQQVSSIGMVGVATQGLTFQAPGLVPVADRLQSVPSHSVQMKTSTASSISVAHVQAAGNILPSQLKHQGPSAVAVNPMQKLPQASVVGQLQQTTSLQVQQKSGQPIILAPTQLLGQIRAANPQSLPAPIAAGQTQVGVTSVTNTVKAGQMNVVSSQGAQGHVQAATTSVKPSVIPSPAAGQRMLLQGSPLQLPLGVTAMRMSNGRVVLQVPGNAAVQPVLPNAASNS